MIEQFYLTHTLTGTTNPARVDLGVMVMIGYSTFPKSPGFEPHHQMQFSVEGRMITILSAGVVEVQRCSQPILQPQLPRR